MNANLDAVLDAVVQAQRNAGYMESTIRQTYVAIRSMKSLAKEKGQTLYTKEFGAIFASMTTSPKTGKFSIKRKMLYGRLVRLCDSYIETGVVDLSMVKRKAPIAFESEEFRNVYDCWIQDMEKRNLAQNTKNYYGCLAVKYLHYLENTGVVSLEKAEPSTILDFLSFLRSGNWSGTDLAHLISNFRPFIKFLGRNDLLHAFEILHPRREVKIFPVLTADEQNSITNTCCSDSVSRRDAAITLLCLTSGIRACDVISLRMDDIDWINSSIVTTQQKTGNPLTIPMLPAVGNALCDYILNERPNVNDDHVFLRSLAPYVPLSHHGSVYNIIKRVQRIAGLDNVPCGSRALRHNIASKMLRSGSQLPTISAVLGQVDPNSTDVYLTTDEEKLRECVLPFPVGGYHG